MSGKFSEKMEKALNEQITHEYASAYLYLAMSACCRDMNFDGFARWFKLQAQEELTHGDKIFDYMVDRGAKVKLLKIDEPRSDWSEPLEMFKDSLEHEKFVTDLINKLMSIAEEDKDYATRSFLQWFVDEQVEEESSV